MCRDIPRNISFHVVTGVLFNDDEEDEVLGEAIDDSDVIDLCLLFLSLQRSLGRGLATRTKTH